MALPSITLLSKNRICLELLCSTRWNGELARPISGLCHEKVAPDNRREGARASRVLLIQFEDEDEASRRNAP